MELSTFELLIKPIAPRTPRTEAVARRVVQGYFLTVSNLEETRLRYTIEFFDSKANPPSSNRSLEADNRPTGSLVVPSNFDLIYDVAGANTELIGIRRGAEGQIAGDFFLDPKQTATVQLLPKIEILLANPDPVLEIRGYVRLRLPGNLFEPQSENPVKVLVQPEIRGTFIPNDFPRVARGDFDQINYSLTTASGKAFNEIKPEPGIVGTFPIAPNLINPDDLFDNFDLASMSDRERIEMLVASLAQVESSEENIQNLDQLLADFNIPIRMSAVNN